MRSVTERPMMPTGQLKAGPQAGFLTTLIKQLVQTFEEYGFRLNRVMPKDSSEAWSDPTPLYSTADADKPAASEWEGHLIYVSDGAAGDKVRYSDGSSWVTVA